VGKPGKRKKKAPLHVRGCAFCSAQIELYQSRWQGAQRREYEAAGWGVIEDVKPGCLGWNACPKCLDERGTDPIDHEIRGFH
jgi:hypothetical protein